MIFLNTILWSTSEEVSEYTFNRRSICKCVQTVWHKDHWIHQYRFPLVGTFKELIYAEPENWKNLITQTTHANGFAIKFKNSVNLLGFCCQIAK